MSRAQRTRDLDLSSEPDAPPSADESSSDEYNPDADDAANSSFSDDNASDEVASDEYITEQDDSDGDIPDRRASMKSKPKGKSRAAQDQPPSVALAQSQPEEDVEEVEEQIWRFQMSNTIRDRAGPAPLPDNPNVQDAPGELDSDEELLYDGNVAPPEFYRQNIRTLNVDDFKRRHYAKGTLKMIENAENYWQSFCEKILCCKDWKKCCQEINFEIIYNFESSIGT